MQEEVVWQSGGGTWATGRSSEKAVRDILRRKRERRTGRVRVFRREQREEEPES